MKRTGLLLILIFICGFPSFYSYTKAGLTVEKEQVITEAISKKNTPLLIKELVNRIKGEIEKDEALYPDLIKEVETYANSGVNPEEAAILHSLLAEMYTSFERQNMWKINQRTPIVGYIPEDINEWTSNLFKEKIAEEYALSLQPAELLAQTSIKKYAELLQTGKDEKLRPTLYDYLIFRALEVIPTDETYQDLIAYKEKGEDMKALMLAELDYLEFRYKDRFFRNDNKTYLAALDSLHDRYASSDFAAEIWITRVYAMENGLYDSDNQDENNLRKEVLSLCEKAINKYPTYGRIGFFKNKKAALENPEMTVNLPKVVYPGKEVSLALRYKNIQGATIKIYETDLHSEKIDPSYYWGSSLDTKNKGNRKLVRQINSRLDLPNTYQYTDTTILVSGLDKAGIYEYQITTQDKKLSSEHIVFSTKIGAVSRTIQAPGAEVLVTDLESGKPIEKAVVKLYRQRQSNVLLVDSIMTDTNGIAKIENKNNIRYYRVEYKDDISTPLSYIYMGNRSFDSRQEQGSFVSLLTDRGLYRPGQRIYVKGIAYEGEKEDRHVSAGKRVNLILRDANHKEVKTQEFTTNEFGSFNGELLLPRHGLSGSFSLSAENTTVYIRVEEYKRPSFFVEVDPIKGEIAFGDSVKIEGKAQTFSGVPLQAGNVNYRVIYRPFRFWGYSPYGQNTQVLYGEASINEDGIFNFDFVPEKPKTRKENLAYATYEVIVTMSDSKGETQETSSFFSVGTSSLILQTDLSDKMKNKNLFVKVTARTLNNQPAETKGQYFIYELNEKGKNKQGAYNRVEGNKVAEGAFVTTMPIGEEVFAALPSGAYRLKLKAADAKGRPVELEQDVVLYTDKDKRPPVFSDTWVTERELSALPGDNVEFVFGTSHKKAYVLYELTSEKGILTRKRLELSEENRTISVPFQKEYGDVITASFTFVKEGKLYTEQLKINRKLQDKTLAIKTETFRDKLMPGGRENWKLKVVDKDTLAVSAEILASMYDASLDQIMPFKWYFDVTYRPFLYVPTFMNNDAYSNSGRHIVAEMKHIAVPEYEYSVLNLQQAMLRTYSYRTRSGIVLESAKVMSAPSGAVKDNALAFSGSVEQEEAPEEVSQETGSGEVSLRKNFDETAFFFPVLRTDENGDFVISFVLPESNTTWKLQALAHTKDMKHGLLTKEVISSKALMVLPNLPRFVRQGDEVQISAQVINRSEDSLSGRVRLEIFDPETDEPLICLTKSQIPFELSEGKQTNVSWTVPVAAEKGLIGIRIVADTETVSDGEQHLLPVLSNEVLVTEITPIYLKGEGEKEVLLPKNKSGYRPYSQTLEISANPVWYAVQALSPITTPAHNSATAWFASYYSNTLAVSIVKANPRLKTIIAQWSAAGEDVASLISNLEKNEELKNILLEETPWVMEASNETEQIRSLASLFDLNRAESQRAEALQELINLQREDGAWGWFMGFGADRYITISILQGMADLVNLNAVEYNQQEREMQMKALQYLDEMIRRDYEWIKKQKINIGDYQPNGLQLDYIFMRSSFRDIPESIEVREAIRYFTDQAEKQWEKLTLHMKAQTALLLHRNGKAEKAQTIMNWFKRTATQSEEKGLYWANNRRTGFSSLSPVETHTFIMTAIAEMKIKDLDVDRMKQWLLNQKRTQYWETTPATLNAVYALLLTGGDWLGENNRIVADWGKETVDTQKGTTGVGYVKKVKKADEIAANERIVIQKTGNTPAWGAVYSQYFAPADQVVKHQGELGIDKKIFIEKTTDKGLQLVPLKEGETLRVGDKAVIRLTIRSKQEMTYVHLKDMRAACFEPTEQLSGTQYKEGISFYKSSKDIAEHFYFDRLPEGTFVIEYGVYVSRAGEYASAPADIQCLYAPEYAAHTDGDCLIIKD